MVVAKWRRILSRPALRGAIAVATGYLIVAGCAATIAWISYARGIDPFMAGADKIGRAIPSVLLLGLSLVGAALLSLAGSATLRGGLEWLTRRRWVFAGGLAIAFFGVAAVIAYAVLDGFPISGDEYAYLFQAEIFRHGRLWAQPWPVAQYFFPAFVFDVGGKLITQYPPGWPAVLAFATSVRLPDWLVNPVVAAGTVPFLYLLAERRFDRQTALLTICFFAGSAFTLLTSASFFNHSFTTLCGVLFVLAASEFFERPRALTAIATGVSFSAIAVTRHYDAVLFALPFAILLLWRQSWALWRLAPLAVVAGLPLFVALLAYYDAVTGSPLQTPQTLRNPADGLLGPNFTIRQATELLLGRGVELAEWTSPPFVLIYCWAFLRRAWRRELQLVELYGVIFPLGYWLYWSAGGARWGPRYIYCAFPFMAMTVARAIRDALLDQPGTWRSRGLAHLGAVSLVIALVQVPFLANGAGKLVTQFEDVYDRVAEERLHHAIVFLSSATGVTWKLGVGNLVRNGLTLDGDVIYAHAGDIMASQIDPAVAAATIADLHAHFPDRSIWIYHRAAGVIHGRLTPAIVSDVVGGSP